MLWKQLPHGCAEMEKKFSYELVFSLSTIAYAKITVSLLASTPIASNKVKINLLIKNVPSISKIWQHWEKHDFA